VHALPAYLDLARTRVERRLGWYVVIVAWCLLAMAFGVFAAAELDAVQRADLLSYLGGFLGSVRSGLPPGTQLMRSALLSDGRLLLIAWACTLCLVGAVLSWFTLGVKSFAIGFSAAFLVGELGGQGVVLVLTAVVPPALLVLPSMMLLCEAAMAYVGDFYRARWRAPGIMQAFWRFGASGALALCGIVLAAVVEAYVSPLALHLLWPYIGK